MWHDMMWSDVMWRDMTWRDGPIQLTYIFFVQLVPAKTHPNFKMLCPCWVCLFWCFRSTKSAQKGISKRTCVPYFLSQPSPSTRYFFCKTENNLKIPKVGILCSNLLQFSDDDSLFWEKFPLTLSKIYLPYLRYTLKVYSPCKIYWGPIHIQYTLYIYYILYTRVTICSNGRVLAGTSCKYRRPHSYDGRLLSIYLYPENYF